MNHAQALHRIHLLRQVTEARGATPNEARVAAHKAAELQAKHGISASDLHTTPAASQRATPPPPRFTGFPSGVMFDPWVVKHTWKPSTGEHTPNVKVHRYKDRGNWKIEIFDE